MWLHTSEKTNVAVSGDGVQFEVSDGDTYIYQTVYGENVNQGDTVTLSALTNSELLYGTYTITGTQTQTFLNEETGFFIKFKWFRNYNSFAFSCGYKAGYSGTVIACKVELGNSQTLATLNDGLWSLNAIPSFLDEELKCKRFINVFTIRGNSSHTMTYPFQNTSDLH